MSSLSTTDREVAAALKGLAKARPSYWSYSTRGKRADSYTLFQYPAMMVPAMLQDLLSTITEADSSVDCVCDPFLGSGSVLTEAMLQGKAFHGTDVNPLALLIAKVKAGPLLPRVLRREAAVLNDYLKSHRPLHIDIAFSGMDKWFSSKALQELSLLRKGIRTQQRLWCRRFFWICLAETVRLSSNSRTSTFKLHIRSQQDLESRKDLSPLEVFESVMARNVKRYEALERALNEKGFLRRGRYLKKIALELVDCRSSTLGPTADLLITSPPYGDNTTTVPYGQHSYLPLQCIDLADIDDAVDAECLSTTRAIDSRSLGGHKENALRDAKALSDVSPNLEECLWKLRDAPADRAVRVATFSRDLHAAVRPILSRLRPQAYMSWVVGNRRVGGIEVPTAGILADFLQAQGATHVTTLERAIPSKRMALRNSVSETMSKEKILVFRNGGRA